jgi:sulfite reductase alpha subunit-like flavoprotein
MISGLEPSWTALVARVVATAKIKPQCSQIVEEGVQNERLVALGRKNALFAGSESGARTWAILASLINTAKLNDLDPHTYLADVLERMISGRTPVNRLDELLAWNWKAARAALATAA